MENRKEKAKKGMKRIIDKVDKCAVVITDEEISLWGGQAENLSMLAAYAETIKNNFEVPDNVIKESIDFALKSREEKDEELERKKKKIENEIEKLLKNIFSD